MGLEELIFWGKKEDTFDLLGHKITIKLLSSEEDLAASRAASGYDIFTYDKIFSHETLIRSLVGVNNRPFKDDQEKRALVAKLQPAICNIILEKYKALRDLQLVDLDIKRRELKEITDTPFLEDSSNS